MFSASCGVVRRRKVAKGSSFSVAALSDMYDENYLHMNSEICSVFYMHGTKYHRTFPLNCLQSKFGGKQKGKHEVAKKRNNAPRQHFGRRKY